MWLGVGMYGSCVWYDTTFADICESEHISYEWRLHCITATNTMLDFSNIYPPYIMYLRMYVCKMWNDNANGLRVRQK